MNWAGLGNSFQLFMGYFLITVVSTIVAVRFAKPGWRKWAAGLGTFGVFWGLTLIDDIMGTWEHKALCEKEAGVKIYKPAKLPPEFYHPDGRPKFIETSGQIFAPALAEFIKFEHKNQDSYSFRYLKIDKTFYRIVDARTKELLAERVGFRRWPSPFVPSIMHGGAKSCEDSAQASYASDLKLHHEVFPNLVNK